MNWRSVIRPTRYEGPPAVWHSVHGSVEVEILGTDQRGTRIRYYDAEGRPLETITDPATVAAYASPSSVSSPN